MLIRPIGKNGVVDYAINTAHAKPRNALHPSEEPLVVYFDF